MIFIGGCHHMKSIDYFTESILGVNYYGCKCPDWRAFKKGICDCEADENLVLMGENIDHEYSESLYFHFIANMPTIFFNSCDDDGFNFDFLFT